MTHRPTKFDTFTEWFSVIFGIFVVLLISGILPATVLILIEVFR